jgi:hypothetical protein
MQYTGVIWRPVLTRPYIHITDDLWVHGCQAPLRSDCISSGLDWMGRGWAHDVRGRELHVSQCAALR